MLSPVQGDAALGKIQKQFTFFKKKNFLNLFLSGYFLHNK